MSDVPEKVRLTSEGFTMPIQNPKWRDGYSPALDGPFVWEPSAADRRQAEANHFQTLERLAQRGGMSWCEMAFIILHQKYDRASRVAQDRHYAKAVCRDVLAGRAALHQEQDDA